jgi:hypothetical protein
MTYARFLMQEHLGRLLDRDLETVDHIDDDPLNDAIENFQLLTRSENLLKATGPVEMVSFVCPVCDEFSEKKASNVKHNRNMGKAGPFCGRSCAGRYATMLQYGSYVLQGHGTNARYNRKRDPCRCAECREAHRIANQQYPRKRAPVAKSANALV